jgi:hypothetical protein
MRTRLVAILAVLAMATTAAPAFARDHTLDVATKSIDFGTFTAPESGTTSDAIVVTNTGDETVPFNLLIALSKPKDWAQSFSPFIIEDVVTPSFDPCPELAPGASCLVFVTFQTDRPGTFSGALWINGTARVKLRAVAE